MAIPELATWGFSFSVLKSDMVQHGGYGLRYGLERSEPAAHNAAAMDQKLLNLLCGQKQLRRRATSMALSWPSHRLFPEMAVPFQTFAMAARQLMRHHSLRFLFEETWRARQLAGDWQGEGVCAHMHRQCVKLDWS